MRYGFTKGGFTVVDDVRRMGSHAYATSEYWRDAKGSPESVAAAMLARDSQFTIPAHIREAAYLHCCTALVEELPAAKAWTVEEILKREG